MGDRTLRPALALRALRRLSPARAWLVPSDSRRHRVLRRLVRALPAGTRLTWALRPLTLDEQYRLWLERNALTPELVEEGRRRAASLAFRPLVSVVMPVHESDPVFLAAAVESVRAQTYDRWELCIADDASSRTDTRELLASLEADGRIKLTRLETRGGIAVASNAALGTAGGDFVALLDHDDELKPDALFEVVKLLNERPDLDFVYSDEDKRDADGNLVSPFFKPDWSPDLELSINYVTHLSVYRRELLERVGGFRPGYDGSQDYDLTLRATEATDAIAHIPRILYTWRMAPGSAAGSMEAKPYAYAAAKRALTDALERRGLEAEVFDGPVLGSYRVRYRVPRATTVTVVTQQAAPPLPESESLRVEVIAGVKGDAAALNAAAGASSGVLVFLGASVEPADGAWLEALVEHALRRDVGAVGARVVDRAGLPQHEGVVVLPGGEPRAVGSSGYFGLGGELIRNWSAVGGGCLATRATVFADTGGFDETFQGELAAVDYCLRVRERGRSVVYTPYAVLRRRLQPTVGAADEQVFRARWSRAAPDPFYNPNLSTRRLFDLAPAPDETGG